MAQVLAIITVLTSMGASPTPGGGSVFLVIWGAMFPQHAVPSQIAFVFGRTAHGALPHTVRCTVELPLSLCTVCRGTGLRPLT